ncbi:hypothetical protein [Rudanella paleaurantiibacter]|uniref:hypothetical protein n=1 Tax=Rudanella paleaurantiibacter TaxID=2614655 RepID=UPI001261481E|nr:hypothetical protein [Rudanella paleaurantiibacter]
MKAVDFLKKYWVLPVVYVLTFVKILIPYALPDFEFTSNANIGLNLIIFGVWIGFAFSRGSR